MRCHLGKMRPIWAICTKSGQMCSRIGQKKYHHLFLYLACFADSETHCVCPTRPSYDRALQQGLGHWLCSQNLRLSPDNLIARWPAGAQTWTQTWTMFPDQLVIKVLSASKVLVNKLSGIWIHLGPLKMPKLRQAVSCFQPSSPRMSRSTRAKLNSALII